MAFTQTSIDHASAAAILEAAYRKAFTLNSPISRFADEIRQVIHGTHVTYRYILVTNLLAKSVNPSANALALQAGADFDGAFDSRSLCHKVLVPFERQCLEGKLGRSNEPYLNKPARIPALSINNPVRKGKDFRILKLCIHVLSAISHEESMNALVDALYFTASRAGNAVELSDVANGDFLHSKLAKLAEIMLETSNEGENSVFVVGLAFHLLAAYSGKKYDIRVHPTNQAGSSSNEILDIDVYEGRTLIYTAEVKDKAIALQDIDHAAKKVLASGQHSFFFLIGPQGDLRSRGFAKEIEIQLNINIDVIPVRDFFMSALGLANDKFDLDYVLDAINSIIDRARFKDSTMIGIRTALDTFDRHIES
jgi:hypothetical protein